jgi:hypothetical protein
MRFSPYNFLPSLLVTALLGLPGGVSLRAQDVSELNYRGQFNGFGSTAMTYDAGGDLWRVTVQQANSGSAFKLAHSSWTYEWTTGGAVTLATKATAFTGGSDSTFSEQSGRYYTFTIYDVPSGNNSALMIQETANAPVGITREAGEEQQFGNAGPYYMDPSDPNGYTENRGVNSVPITLTAAPSTGEKVYVRYTIDNFSTSSVVEASGSGTDFLADIPAQPRGTTVHYFAFTTTVASPSHADRDLETIALNTNGANGQYATLDLGNTWHFPETTVPGAEGSPTYFMLDLVQEELELYLGNQRLGGGDAATISTAVIHWRKQGDAWASQTPISMAFSHNIGNDEFYVGSLDLSGFTPNGSFFDYYFEVNYSSGATETFVFGGGPPNLSSPSDESLISGFETDQPQINPMQFQYGASPAAVPEPNSFMLGLFGLALIVRLRRQGAKRPPVR